MRATARWGMVAAALAVMIAVLGTGPRAAQPVRATQPDVYQALGGSSAVNVMGFQTGSPVDPAPAVNEAFPLTSITADNGPASTAHAAYLEPPGTAQAATGLNNVPVPYATAVDAQCNACGTPRTADADGNVDLPLDGTRVQASAGRAHAQANQTAAIAAASDGEQTVAPFDQIRTLVDALAEDLYTEVINKPSSPSTPIAQGLPTPPQGTPPPPVSTLLARPPCVTSPASPSSPLPQALSTFDTVCSDDLPFHNELVSADASDATTQVVTDTEGTVIHSSSQLDGVRLIDGLISIGTIRTDVTADGDGTAKGTTIDARTDVLHVCIGDDCSYSLTAAGICKDGESLGACQNDQLNQSLREHGFNICRLGTSSTRHNTDTAASASGVLVEFHAMAVPAPPPPGQLPAQIQQLIPGSTYTPDPTYYGSSLCEAAPPAPHAGWSGISVYAILGSSSAQLHTDLFPPLTSTVEEITNATVPELPASSSTTTIINNVNGGGVYPGSTPVRAQPPSYAAVYGGNGVAGHDRRPLMLTVFGLLEVILMSNLTAMARARRRAM
jgi:hypothetical protein